MILTILIWFIAVSLACIAFALGGLWISETLTRLRRTLKPQTSRGVYLLIIPTALVSLSFSIIALRMLIQAHVQLNYDRGWLLTPPALISMSVIVFALLLTIAGLIGDRSRGRLRCPRCWYDTSAGTDLRCPECGYLARSERVFQRSRRPKWVFVCAAILCSGSVYTLAKSESIQRDGAFTLVPTWTLMLGWDVLPETWITHRSSNPIEGCLEDRINSGSIGTRRITRFMRRLSAPLDDNPDLCLDFKRMSLLALCIYELDSTSMYNDQPERGIPLPGIDLDSTLSGYAEVYFNAVLAQNPSPEQIELLQQIENESSAWGLIQYWISIETMNELGHDEFDDEAKQLANERSSRAMAPIRDQLHDPAFIAAIQDPTSYVSTSAVMLLTQAGMLPDLVEHCLSIPEQGAFVQDDWFIQLLWIRQAMLALNDDDLERVMSKIHNTIRNGNTREQSFTLFLLSFYHFSDSDAVMHRKSDWFVAQREVLYHATSEFRTGAGRWGNRIPIASSAIRVLAYTYEDPDRYLRAARAVMDRTNSTAWPSISGRRSGTWPAPPVYATPEYIQSWTEHMLDLPRSSVEARMWMAQNAPFVMPGDDNRLDQLIWDLIADPNDDVSYEAIGRYSFYLDDWIERNADLLQGEPTQRMLAIEQFPEMPPAGYPEMRDIGLRLIMDTDPDVARVARKKLHRLVEHFGME